MNSYDASEEHLWRQLQFGAGGGAGGIFLGNPNTNNMTNMDNGNNMQDDNSGSPTATGIVIFLALSAAGIVGLVVATWGISYITDRLCCCCPWYQPVSNLSDFQANFDRGPIARKAHLWGLTVEDRLKILTAFFQKRVFLYDKTTVQEEEKAHDSEEDDIEEGLMPKEDAAKSPELPKDTTAMMSNDDGNSEAQQESDEVDPVDLESGKKDDADENEKDEDAVGEAKESGNDDNSNNEPGATEEGGDGEDEDDAEKTEKPEEAGMDDADHERICCICLNEYEQGDKLMTGTQCIHKLHFDCCMEWVRKHDHCPYCREEMLTPAEMREQAIETLGEAKVKVFSSGAAPPVTEPTTVEVPPPQTPTETSPPTGEAEAEEGYAGSDQPPNDNEDKDAHDEENPPPIAGPEDRRS